MCIQSYLTYSSTLVYVGYVVYKENIFLEDISAAYVYSCQRIHECAKYDRNRGHLI